MILTLMKGRDQVVAGYPPTFHVGFFIDSRVTVEELSARMRSDGLDAKAPKETNHSCGFYVRAPGGVMVEVGA